MDLRPLFLSFEVAALATLLSTFIGIALGTLLSRRFRGRDLLDVLITAPMVLPPTVLGYYALTVLGRRSAIGHLFEAITGSSIVFTRAGAVIAAAIGGIPIVAKSARAALEGVDPTLVLAARTLGASSMRSLFTIRLPLAARGLTAGLMLAFARSLGDFGLTLMIAGDLPGETQTASLAIYDAIQSQKELEAAAMAMILTAIALMTLYVVNKLAGRHNVL